MFISRVYKSGCVFVNNLQANFTVFLCRLFSFSLLWRCISQSCRYYSWLVRRNERLGYSVPIRSTGTNGTQMQDIIIMAKHRIPDHKTMFLDFALLLGSFRRHHLSRHFFKTKLPPRKIKITFLQFRLWMQLHEVTHCHLQKSN